MMHRDFSLLCEILHSSKILTREANSSHNEGIYCLDMAQVC